MNVIVKNKKILIVTVVILLIGFIFYWYALRPVQIRTHCHKRALKYAQEQYGHTEKGTFRLLDYNFGYEMCLNECGLVK